MELLVDWTLRKRPRSASPETDPGGASAPAEEPFAFVKKRQRCRLACCTTSVLEQRGSLALSVSDIPAVFLLPPLSEGKSWLSGVSTALPGAYVSATIEGDDLDDEGHNGGAASRGSSNSRGQIIEGIGSCSDSDDPFMEDNTKVSLTGAPSPLGVLAHEIDIDDCLRCASGGYQHFRVTVTDGTRGLAGAMVAERTGGDVLALESEHLQFTTSKSYADASAVPLLERYFPSVVRKVVGSAATKEAGKSQGSTSTTDEPGGDIAPKYRPEELSLLKECVVCVGSLTLNALPMQTAR